MKLNVKQILCIKLVKYWDKYTKMHGQQNVKKYPSYVFSAGIINHLRDRGWWYLPDMVTRAKPAAIMSPCTISGVGGNSVSQSFDDEVTDSLETLQNSPITTRLRIWEDAILIQPHVKASGSLLKLYIYIPTNCTQLIFFMNNTLKYLYCLKL